MISLKLAKLSFILLSVIFYTKTDLIFKSKLDQLDNLLQSSGWKNLNDLISIKYYNKLYNLQNLLEIPVDRFRYKQKIRTLTIFLGCTYANVVNNLFPVLSNITIICQKKLIEEKDFINGCIYTEQLINIIYLLIVPLATLMKGAMDTLDSLHTNPLSLQKYTYMISPRLKIIRNILDYLNKQTLSRDDISTYIKILNHIENFFSVIMLEVIYDCEIYCEFAPHSKNYLWNDWNLEYTAINRGIELVFFLNSKIEDYTKTVIIDKYFQLGFTFDPITEETFLLMQSEQFELELEFKAFDEKPPTLIDIEYYCYESNK